MEKLKLINWNDKRAKDVESKITIIQKKVSEEEKKLNDALNKVKCDNEIQVLYSFNPEEYKV